MHRVIYWCSYFFFWFFFFFNRSFICLLSDILTHLLPAGDLYRSTVGETSYVTVKLRDTQGNLIAIGGSTIFVSLLQVAGKKCGSNCFWIFMTSGMNFSMESSGISRHFFLSLLIFSFQTLCIQSRNVTVQTLLWPQFNDLDSFRHSITLSREPHSLQRNRHRRWYLRRTVRALCHGRIRDASGHAGAGA